MQSSVREGDTVFCHSMDRLARNLDDLRRIVLGLTERGVHIVFVKENLTFTGEDSPMSNLLLSVMGAFAQFERELIRERQREGIAIARREGKYTGRKPSLSPARAAELRRPAADCDSKSALAREFGISRDTLYIGMLRSKSAGPVSLEDELYAWNRRRETISESEMQAELERLLAENAQLKSKDKGGLSLKVSLPVRHGPVSGHALQRTVAPHPGECAVDRGVHPLKRLQAENQGVRL